jgi:hypothetical protein
VPAANVIYMSPPPTGMDGANLCNDRSAGCATLQHAIGRLTGQRKYILMAPNPEGGMPYLARSNNGDADFDGVAAHVIGYDARLRRAGDGTIVRIRNNANVVVEGLTVEFATGSGGRGIDASGSALALHRAQIANNSERGVSASSMMALRVTRSTIANNRGGGLFLDGGTFTLINNLIYKNGLDGDFGGLSLNAAGAGNVLDFNTIAANLAGAGSADQVRCTVSGAVFVGRNNIISARPDTTGGGRIGGSCTYASSMFSPSGPPGNMNMDLADPAGFLFKDDFRLNPGSAAAGKADSARLGGESLFDVDGEPRAPNSNTVDVGADEIP